MSAAAALLLATLLETRLSTARTLAAEGQTAQAEEAYRGIIAQRKEPLAGDDEIAALTAVNELAELLIASNRANDALALYENLPPPADADTRLAVDYSTAVAAVAAERWPLALEKSISVVSEDPLYASAAKLLVASMARAPAEESTWRLVETVHLLARAGLMKEARSVITAALRSEDACGAADSSPLAYALVAYAAQANDPSLEQFTHAQCEPVAQVASALEGVFSADEARLTAGLERLKAAGLFDRDIERLLKNRWKDAIHDGQLQYAYDATLTLMRTGLSERSPIEAAYLLSQNPGADPTGQTAAEIAHAARFLSGEDLAAVHLHLGGAAMARGDAAAATAEWREAERLYAEKRTPVPLLKVSLARAMANTVDTAVPREYYLSAARDCTLLENQRCTEKVLGEAYARNLIDAETAASFGVTPETLKRNAPKQDEPGPGQPRMNPPRRNVSAPFGRSPAFKAPLVNWNGSAYVSSSLPLSDRGLRLDAAPPETPVERIDEYDLHGGGPLLGDALSGTLGIERHDTRVRIARTANDTISTSERASVHYHPKGGLQIYAAAAQRAVDETGAGAEPGRARDATISRNGDITAVTTGAGFSRKRLVLELELERSSSAWNDEPAPGAGTIAVFGADGIQRSAGSLLRDTSRTDSLWATTTLWPTDHLRFDVGTDLRRIDEEQWLRSSPVNAEAIAREVGGTRNVDVLRLARSSPVEVSRDLDAAWTSVSFDDDRFHGFVGLRFQYERGESQSDGTAASSLVPSCLPALPSARSAPLSSRVAVPRVLFGFRPWDVYASYGRYADSLRTEAMTFTNPAAWAVFDLGYGDLNRNGYPDGQELLHVIPLAAYGATPNTRGRIGPEIRDEVRVSATRSIRNATYGADIAVERVSHIAGTRPFIVDGDGNVRPAMRDDYVLDRTITTKSGPVATYRLRFAPTGAWQLAEDDRRRDIRTASLSWRYRWREWIMAATGTARQDQWSIGRAFRERNDPTPLAAGRDFWGFERGNIDGMAAADAYFGADRRSLAIPNNRWSVQLGVSGSPLIPLIQSLNVSAALTIQEGAAVSPYVSVFGADGIERPVAVTRRAERLPMTQRLDLRIQKVLLVGSSEVTAELSCVSCAGEGTILRRVNQLNHPRAGATEETVRRRMFLAGLHVRLGR